LTRGASKLTIMGAHETANDRTIVRPLGRVGSAFFGGFSRLRQVQRLAVPPVWAGRSVLVAAATASGKTEAVLAPMTARLRSRSDRTRILVVVPTRALVNDLYRRVEAPLGRVGLTCGCQTSDHRHKSKRPFVLITTPESFDSMLVRDGEWQGGRIKDHLLSQVDAVFVDEAHLFDGNPRGDQLPWLLGRLRRLRTMRANPTRGVAPPLQICAASATISDPEGLAHRLLGSGATVVRARGVREIELFGPSPNNTWLPLEPSLDIAAIRQRLQIVTSDDFPTTSGQRLWLSLSGPEEPAMRKILAFVPTRKLADELAAHWATSLKRHRELEVLAHHGSLSRARRESAEKRFGAAADAVLVATTTMEVGIDIGDVDLVALVGAPPGTRSLLQRIGRGGRRIGQTRVLALPRNEVERAALASELHAARDGELEPEGNARRWSVFVQQTASFVAQQKARGRRRSDLLALAVEVWPEDPPTTAEAVVDALVAADHIQGHRHRLTLGKAWADRFSGRGMHANIGSEAPGVPVVDASTGDEIARVRLPPSGKKAIALGGQNWDLESVLEREIRLKPVSSGPIRETFEYSTRRAPTGREYAAHVRRGFGFDDSDAPMLEHPEGAVWFHFGGSGYEKLLCSLAENLAPVGRPSGLALRGAPDDGSLSDLASHQRLAEAVLADHEGFEPLLGAGPYQDLLPTTTRRKVVTDLLDLERFRRWLESRRTWIPRTHDPRLGRLRAILKGES